MDDKLESVAIINALDKEFLEFKKEYFSKNSFMSPNNTSFMKVND
jgi:hypothetical protein